jgi:adenylate cyclase
VRGFTRLAEHRDPQEVVSTMNEYFTRMTAVIQAHGGTIDKFIGDAILAVFGAPVPRPDHALRAIQAAREMQAALEQLNAPRVASGLPPLQMGIAVHTGTVLAGNVGSPERMEYTVMGDAVNVTARIEELNKTYGTRILLSETTYAKVGDMAARFIGAVTLRGRDDPIRLYAA